MPHCDLRDSCFFFNGQTTDSPYTTEFLKKLYCKGFCFAECALYKISRAYGKDKVPKYLYPNDMFVGLNFERHGRFDTLLKVISPDGTTGMAKASTIDGLMKAGKIIAFHCPEGWVEVRRKINQTRITKGQREDK